MGQAGDDHARTLAILIVEDDPAGGELIGTVLKDVAGWTATVAHDAASARSAFQQVEMSALVLDINLPGITGLELLALLRGEPAWRDPAVILMSADEHQPGIREALAEGAASAFLAKPLNLDHLVDTIWRAVDG
jgi:CheY-like chemotaxis protein